MKKKLFDTGINWKKIYSSKLWKIMRLSGFLFIVCVFQVLAGRSYSQSTKLSLNLNQAKISQVLNEIENQSEFYFLYNHKLIDVDRKVDINVKDKRIKDILTNLFAGKDIDCLVMDRQIVLSAKDVTKTVSITKDRQPQEIVVKGKVTDEDGNSLPGVNIIIKGTLTGTITNADGNYSTEVDDPNATLVFSFIGYRTQEIAVSGQTTINVTLSEEATGLEEIVVIGFGTQKKVNLTGSVSTVGSDDLVKRPVNNPITALQGQALGLQITQETGQPGREGIMMQIRGMGTFSGAGKNPLVIIDGIAGDLSSLNSNDIESISVLKDAASSAIYGSRAANGVILVTTKSGKKGELKVNYHGSISTNKHAIIPELVWNSVEYMEMVNKAIDSSNGNQSEKYSTEIIDAYRNNAGNPQYPNTNWYDEITQTALVHNHYLGVSGGEGKTQYNFGAGIIDQDGITRGHSMKKYNLLFSIDSEVNKYIEFGTRINMSNRKVYAPFGGGTSMFTSAIANRPTYGPRLLDGSGRFVDKAYPHEWVNKNVVALIEGPGYDNSDKYNVIASAYMKFNISKDLNLLTKGAITYTDEMNNNQKPSEPLYYWHTGAFSRYNMRASDIVLNVNRTRNVLTTFYSTLNYQKNFNEEHDLGAVLGYNQEEFRNDYLAGRRIVFPSERLTVLNAGEAEGQLNWGSGYEWTIQSIFGRLNYAYKGKYLFESSFRYDGSSRFSKENRWGLFPSVSAAWRISEEPFIKDAVAWVDNLKIRASYGILGNQDIAYYPYQDLISTDIGYPYGGSFTQGAIVTGLSNKDITWETTTKFDIGFDLSLSNRMLYLTFDYFNNLTSDILRELQIPDYIGLSGPTVNDGEMQNTGIEFQLGHSNSVRDFSYDVNLNVSTYKNKLKKFGATEIASGFINYIREEGLPWNSFYTLEYIGIFQNEEEIANSPTQPYNPRPGDLKFRDVNDDNVINQEDRVVIDGKFPKFNYGFNAFLKYKNFDLSAFFYGVAGKKMYGVKHGADPFFQGSPPHVSWRDAWTPENQSTTMPRLYYARNGYQAIQQASSFWLHNASYLRLKNIQIGYNLSSIFHDKSIISNARVYFSGDNLLTFTSMKFGGEPERTVDSRNTYFPQIKAYSFGVNVEF